MMGFSFDRLKDEFKSQFIPNCSPMHPMFTDRDAAPKDDESIVHQPLERIEESSRPIEKRQSVGACPSQAAPFEHSLHDKGTALTGVENGAKPLDQDLCSNIGLLTRTAQLLHLHFEIARCLVSDEMKHDILRHFAFRLV